jgi:hypothetical protein
LYREDSGLVDGLSYGDYVEQLTFLLFIKMADEHTRPPFNKPSTIPNGYDWPSLLDVMAMRLKFTTGISSRMPVWPSPRLLCSSIH